jgi:hypothetical protein
MLQPGDGQAGQGTVLDTSEVAKMTIDFIVVLVAKHIATSVERA